MPHLKIEEHDNEREIKINGDRFTIGRLPENDVVLADETVSRHHAELILKPDGYLIKDLATKNGTRVNGKMIKEAILKNGDTIRIGAIGLQFFSGELSVFFDVKEEWLDSPSTMVRPLHGPSIAVSQGDKLKILYNISQALSSIFDVKGLAKKIADEVLKIIDADRLLLILRDEKTSEFIPEIAIGRDKKEVELNISQTMVKRVTTEGISILVRNTMEDSRFRKAQSLVAKNIWSILCVPLWSKEGIIGLLYADTKKQGKSFSEDEMDLLNAIGNQAAIAFQNIRAQEKLWEKKRVERELEIAARIQQSFLPCSFPSWPGYSFSVRTISAYNIGGDFYDCFSLSPQKAGIVVGDVSGKGIPAALYMARFLSEFKLASVSFPGPGLLMDEMNKRLKEIVIGGNFVSAAYLILDMNTTTLTYAMAGCHPILFYHDSDKSIKELFSSCGQVLGICEGSFKDETINLGCSDAVVLYTDGVIEARNKDGQEFGLERLKQEVLKFNALSADDVTGNIIEDIFSFSQGHDLSDDLTLLVLKRLK